MEEFDQELLDLLTSNKNASTNATNASNAKPSAQSSVKQKRPPVAAKRPRRRMDDSESELSESSESSDDFDALSSGSSAAASDDSHDSQDELDAELDALEDESNFQGLTELEREEKMAEVAERKQRLLERMEIKKRLKGVTAQTKRQKRLEQQKSSNKKALQQLKAKRSRKTRSSKEDDEDDLLRLEDESDEEQDYRERIRGTYGRSDEPSDKRSEVWMTVDNANQIRITRDNLEKWVYTPFFEDVVIGSLVRVGLGLGPNKQPVYRCAEVVDVVDYHRTYKFNQLTTRKALKLRHGKAERVFLMDIISNSDFTEGEFQRWLSTMKQDKQRVMSQMVWKEKQKQLETSRNHAFTDEEISFMIKEKQKTFAVPKNLSVTKLKLLAERDTAEQHQDHQTVQRLDQEIQNIDATLATNGDTSTYGEPQEDVWAKLNERNRKKNFEDIAKAEQQVRQQRMEDILGSNQKKRGGKGDGGGVARRDPFARIKAVPQVQVHTRDVQVVDDQSQLSTPVEGNGSGAPSTALQSPANGGESGGGGALPSSAPADAYTAALESVDIDIDI